VERGCWDEDWFLRHLCCVNELSFLIDVSQWL
jgi:hypothetical protein